MRRALHVLLVVAAATAPLAPARAERVSEPGGEDWEEPKLYIPKLRRPPALILGFDAGIGVFAAGCSGCGLVGGLGLATYVGAQVGRRVALLVDGRTIIHPLPVDGELSGMLTVTSFTGAVQTWITPVLWIRSGFGTVLRSQVDNLDRNVRIGPGGTLAIGSEQKHRPDFGIDLSGTLTLGGLEAIDGGRELAWAVAGYIGAHWN